MLKSPLPGDRLLAFKRRQIDLEFGPLAARGPHLAELLGSRRDVRLLLVPQVQMDLHLE